MPDASWSDEAPVRADGRTEPGDDAPAFADAPDPTPPSRERAAIARLKAELAERTHLLARREAALERDRRLFDGACEAARIGIWQCRLEDEALHWTDAVYDMFDLPRGSALDRRQTLKLYADASLEALHRTRGRALAERTGFTMDAEIVTGAGRRRWIRLTASVECDRGGPVRLFGMKQDITEEKLLSDRMRHLAEFDGMTGLANRSRFQSRLSVPGGGDGQAPVGALLLVDLDGFKQINDTYGHALGDECLKEAASRLRDACRAAELVARIGGDEFAVILGPLPDRDAAERLARRIVQTLGRPVELDGQSLRLGASVGIARRQSESPADLFAKADTALYAAKAAGRGTFRVFIEAAACA